MIIVDKWGKETSGSGISENYRRFFNKHKSICMDRPVCFFSSGSVDIFPSSVQHYNGDTKLNTEMSIADVISL